MPHSSPIQRAIQRTIQNALRDRVRINLSWLVQLRWAATLGQLVTIATVGFVLGYDVPVAELLAVIAGGAASNVFLMRGSRRLQRVADEERVGMMGELLVASILALDIVLLTFLLLVAGGPANPFSIFYLVNLALGALMLRTLWVWALAIFVMVAYVSLFFIHQRMPGLPEIGSATPFVDLLEPRSAEPTTVLVHGTFVAIAVAALIIVYFITRLRGELESREQELTRARERQATSQRFEALATLAAGAAHELSSPLSTIAVIARELERELLSAGHADHAVEDARLVRQEVSRCRVILDRMSHEAGEMAGETMADLGLAELVNGALEEFPSAKRIVLTLAERDAGVSLRVPRRAFEQSLRSLLQNAVDASEPGRNVHLEVRAQDAGIEFVVRDWGGGMPAEVLARAGDPFYTTKEPGEGMGLGLFLVRAVVERLGGQLAFESEVGFGTTVTMTLPRVP